MIPVSDVNSQSMDCSDINRYFYSGDGHIRLVSEKNGLSFSGRYRKSPGGYDEKAMAAICRVFDAPYHASSHQDLSLRLLEFLDFLEDRLKPGARIIISSGYRDPEYNTGLRNRGALAAKASLHQYGMAADLKISGVSPESLRDYVKALGFGGVGYYHGDMVHLDVGPARSWDENTSGVGTGISDDNKLIGLVTDFDVYLPGAAITLRFIRMTAFPIAVNSEFVLLRKHSSNKVETVCSFKPSFAISAADQCPKFNDIEKMASIQWELPSGLKPGRYLITARFCDNPWEEMPAEVKTPEFELKTIKDETPQEKEIRMQSTSIFNPGDGKGGRY